MLSAEEKRVLGIALGDREMGESIGNQIDAGANNQADEVNAIGVTSDLSLGSPTPSALNAVFDDTEVEAALDLKADQSDVSDLSDSIEARLDVIEAKVDEVIQALKDASIMAS